MQNTLQVATTAAMSDDEAGLFNQELASQWAWMRAGYKVGFTGKQPWFYKRKFVATLFKLGLMEA
jgi:hypothetical protein